MFTLRVFIAITLCLLLLLFVFVYLIGSQCAVILLVPEKVRVIREWLLADLLVKHEALKLLHTFTAMI